MFKSAATKIAHNSTLPALAINQDLRPLQDLITAEKTVILSLQRLATDLSKASEALKAWGLGEGDDLGDVLTASATILTHFTSALSQYASHGHFMREQLKSIRTREENLDELKRRRRNVNSKADAAEKKLHRMNPEHKNFIPQTELLNKLRDEIRGLDVDIMKDEASIGDFKRSATRTLVGLKFGGLIECCEKGVIAGEYGKLIVSEIPNEQTQPGLPRSPYFAHSRIGDLVAEAHRCVNEVRLSTVPSTSPPPQQLLPQVPHVSDSPFMTQGAFSPAQHHPQPRFAAEQYGDDPARRHWEQQSPVPGTLPRLDSPVDSPMHHSPQHRYSNSLSNAALPSSLSGRRVDEFGTPIGPTDAGGARFATFPVKARSASTSGIDPGAFSLIATPPPTDRRVSDSFSSSVAQALAATASQEPESTPLPKPGRFSKDGPAPSYEASVNKSPSLGGDGTGQLVEEARGVEESHVDEEGSKHVRFGRVDAIPGVTQQQSSSEEAESSGPQARLARLLQNEDEDQNNVHEQSLDAAAAREVALEINTPTDVQQQQVPPMTMYASPPGSSPSSPVRMTELERAPTYTEKPISYHNQHGTPSPVVPSTPPSVQQQYPQYPGASPHEQPYSYGYYDFQQLQQQHQQNPLMSASSPAGHVYQQGGVPEDVYPDDKGQDTEFYNPYGGHQDGGGGGGGNLSSSMSSPPQISLTGISDPVTPQKDKGYTSPPPPPPAALQQSPSQLSSSLSIGDSEGNGNGKSRSPLYERGPSAPYMMKPGSNSSLNSLTGGGGGGGGGKISAAAFKRPSPRIGSNTGSPFSSVGGSSPSVQPLKVGKRQELGEGQYDYIGAYMNENEGEDGGEGGERGRGDVGAGVGTYYYNGLGGGGGGVQGK